jgi:hypothetical protein
MIYTIVRVKVIGAGAASRYGSGSDQIVRLLVAPAPQHWQKPIIFYPFLFEGEEKANLVDHCLVKLQSLGIIVAGVTCDGPASNFAMLSSLGASFLPGINGKYTKISGG